VTIVTQGLGEGDLIITQGYGTWLKGIVNLFESLALTEYKAIGYFMDRIDILSIGDYLQVGEIFPWIYQTLEDTFALLDILYYASIFKRTQYQSIQTTDSVSPKTSFFRTILTQLAMADFVSYIKLLIVRVQLYQDMMISDYQYWWFRLSYPVTLYLKKIATSLNLKELATILYTKLVGDDD